MPGASAQQEYDQVLNDIADYLLHYEVDSDEAYRMARYVLMDTMGCAVAAMNVPECIKLLGPLVPGMSCVHGARVPGTQFELDPATAAFNFGTAARWLEMNDSFTAVEGGHPSDNLGAILCIADHLSRSRVAQGEPPLSMREVLTAMIKAYEIQGGLMLQNGFTGYDYLLLTRISATAVATHMLGGGRDEILSALSHAWADGAMLKVYRQGENTGSRKGWAAGDTARRAVELAVIAIRGEMGIPTVLSAGKHGFYDVLYGGKPFQFSQPYGSYVMENVVFKYVPAGNHGQTAVECATRLHPLVKDRIADIRAITIKTQSRLMRIMDKKGPLTNPAARDHCVQYIVAVGLIHGVLDVDSFSDEFAADPRIDALRAKMTVTEDKRFTREFTDPKKRSSANAIQVTFKDGSRTPKVVVEFPFGHPRRLKDAGAVLRAKFERSLARRYSGKRVKQILSLCDDGARLEATPVHVFMGMLAL